MNKKFADYFVGASIGIIGAGLLVLVKCFQIEMVYRKIKKEMEKEND